MESKKFRRSKEPSLKQLEFMAENVSKKLNTSCKFMLECWYHNTGNKETNFCISLVPGFNSTCSQFNYTDWEQTTNQYLFLMESKNLEVQSE